MVYVIALFAIAILASNSLSGGAVNVPVGVEYPAPPEATAIIPTSPVSPIDAINAVVPVTGVRLAVTVGLCVYNDPPLVILIVPIAPFAARVAVAVAT